MTSSVEPTPTVDHLSRARDWRDLSRGEEPHLDYKGPLAWDDAGKLTLLKHIIAMSNLRDGGTIVVGIKENETRDHEVAGLSDAQLATFDATDILQYVNNFVQPGVRLQVCREELDGKRIIVLRVAEFEAAPNICTRSGPAGCFQRGQVLIRTSAAQSRAIENESEMNDLLALALSKRSEALLRSIRHVVEGKATIDEVIRFERRDDDWTQQRKDLFLRIQQSRSTTAMVGCRIIPHRKMVLPEGDAKQIRLLQSASVHRDGWEFPWTSYDKQTLRAGFISFAEDVPFYEHEWRFYEDGALLYWEALAEEEMKSAGTSVRSTGPFLIFSRLCGRVATAFIFAMRLSEATQYEGPLDVEFWWTQTKGRKLVFETPQMWNPDRFECAEPEIRQLVTVQTADLQAGWEGPTSKVLKTIARLFQIEDPAPTVAAQLEKFRRGI